MGTYATPDGRQVYYQDADTLRDAADLYAVLNEDHQTGSPNLENEIARGLVETLQKGGSLSGEQIGALLRLLDKHADAIAALRASPDRDGQDMLAVPDPATARIIDTPAREAARGAQHMRYERLGPTARRGEREWIDRLVEACIAAERAKTSTRSAERTRRHSLWADVGLDADGVPVRHIHEGDGPRSMERDLRLPEGTLGSDGPTADADVSRSLADDLRLSADDLRG